MGEAHHKAIETDFFLMIIYVTVGNIPANKIQSITGPSHLVDLAKSLAHGVTNPLCNALNDFPR